MCVFVFVIRASSVESVCIRVCRHVEIRVVALETSRREEVEWCYTIGREDLGDVIGGRAMGVAMSEPSSLFLPQLHTHTHTHTLQF